VPAPAALEREAYESFVRTTRVSSPPDRRLFDEESAVRCLTAGNDVLNARALTSCSENQAPRDIVICSVAPARANAAAPVEVRIAVRSSY
jgi:hypothetical protein